MNVTFLGTGTSHGIPAIGCSCAVCRSVNPRNKRRRTSVYVQVDEQHIIIDTPPDFRDQVLTFGVSRVDFVLLTHAHADHIFGFDDLRRFGYMQRMAIPVYGSPVTIEDMKEKFSYVIKPSYWSATVPRVAFRSFRDRLRIGAVDIEPVDAPHGPMRVYGYVLRHAGRSIGYLPDVSQMDDALIDRFRGVDVMVLNALRKKEHPTHLSLRQSVEALKKIQAGQSFLTHLCHDLEHDETQAALPAKMAVAYDGLVLDW